ncbi:NAD(P)H-dependent oxidoreductase [Kordiimonas sp. SCSIO 12603]|uniref:FMN-dependent NADH-azoreductase n=1 Tax=Kordiimonas sp. SCSIO 12603 TaxID=2829596 RepID=UPI00210800AA|nr:NAD(P)H-dependent oxidoreductase [Kordiimonas sp. SCSIO 12603]UTW57938.1 NAD(P)H-dependent oxidoreductase [Kordiimonas sp. SCSIO 12603]
MTHTKLLRIDSSARTEASVSRMLADKLIDHLSPATVISRDVAGTMPFIDESWVGANFTPPEDRTDEQKERLTFSDELISELKAADTIVISSPAYNFSVPASLKAWIDLVCRAGVTFRYTENGPEGILEQGKKAYIVFTSGGTPAGADYDYATSYLKHIMSFIGIYDVTIVAADQLGQNADEKIEAAMKTITEVAA